MSSMEAVIVLNAGYEFMGLVSWQRAMLLVFNGKVEVVKESDRIVRTVSRTFRIPAVIRLIKFIRQIYRREVPFSRKNILVRDLHVCQYCGREFNSSDLTIDHIIPKVQGGANEWTNVVACCRSCNIRKGGRTPRQAGMHLVHKPFKPTIMEFINLYLRRRFGVELSEILDF
jgi:5-methylcytosine-specific restriction endonuclease McrA